MKHGHVKLRAEHLKVFGSLVHVKTLGRWLKKIEDKIKPIIFIGYEVRTKCYIYFNQTLVVYISVEM